MIFYRNSTISILILLLLFTTVFPQNYPDKIRGDKVYQTDISVITDKAKSSKNKNPEAIIKIGEPELSDFSLTGITMEISAEIEGIDQSGKIDFLSFEDFKVNNLDVEIEEYQQPFEFKKNEKILLPKPVKVFLSTGQTLRGAYKELSGSKKEWTVTGKVFVFGKFKKFGFSFKRVVPIAINLKIENPIKKKLAQNEKQKTEFSVSLTD